MTKTLRKAIMRRFQLERKYLKIQILKRRKLTVSKRIVAGFIKKERKKYYDQLDLKNITKQQ